jgi:hypothetical protein
MTVLLALAFLAGSLLADGPTGERAYLLDHPVDPDRLILATHAGRYAVPRVAACPWMRPGAVVEVQALLVQQQQADSPDPAWTPGLLLVVPADGGGPGCSLVPGLVDSAPCLTDAAGECDVALEQQPS